MTLVVAILIIGLLTYGMRLSFIVWFHEASEIEGIRRILRFIPVTVLTALIVPDLFSLPAAQHGHWITARLIAGIAAIVVAWRTRQIFATMIVGMIILWVTQLWLPGS